MFSPVIYLMLHSLFFTLRLSGVEAPSRAR